MTIRKKRPKKELAIDLTGPDGNAYALMAYAERFARQLGLNSEKIIEEMMASDDENLLQVFDSNFGSFVILER